jgi:hypothetical protein
VIQPKYVAMALIALSGLSICPCAFAQVPPLQLENTGLFRIVPGDPFVGGDGAQDGCTLEEGKPSERFQIKMSFGESYLQFASDDESLRHALRKPIDATQLGNPNDTTYQASVDFFKGHKSIGGGTCTLSMQWTQIMISNPANAHGPKIISPGYLFEVTCQPKNRGTLQGQIFCRLRTRGR